MGRNSLQWRCSSVMHIAQRDLQTFIGVNEMTSVVNRKANKQKGALNVDLFELKIDFLQELLEMFFSIFDLIFSNVPSMSLRSLSICAITYKNWNLL
jgi:hypothetical protein